MANIKPIVIPKVGNLLTARPEGMDFETYKHLRKEQQRRLHGYNEITGTGKNLQKRHIMGRLEGILIPASQWVNAQVNQVVIQSAQ